MLMHKQEVGQRITFEVPGWPPIELLIESISGKLVRLAINADRRIRIVRPGCPGKVEDVPSPAPTPPSVRAA